MNKQQKIIFFLKFWKLIICYAIFKHNMQSSKLQEDLNEWIKENGIKGKNNFWCFSYFILFFPEERNIVDNRLHKDVLKCILFRLLFKPLNSLYINMPTEKIDGGLYFQHGFSTIVSANKIGKRCHINQQVTIGFNGQMNPIIEDDCTICAGAIVIGGVTIHNNSVIGAGSVVTSDVAENSIVVGVPAKFLKQNKNV
jgi:serine O-acetyltransferase